MSKTKKNETPHYELLYLVSNQFSEDELGPVKAKVEKLITDNGGTITRRDSLGKKRLAYKIKQFRHGYYELLEFDAPPAALPQINNQLKLDSDILRHQTVKGEPKTPQQLAKEAKAMSELQKAEKDAEIQEPRGEAEVKTRRPESAPQPLKVPVKDDKDKVELSDLDDKLNQILDTDNLL